MPSKHELLQRVIKRLEEEHAALSASASATRAGAVHEESRAENDKDTRALEASYLARGQAKRVAETTEVLALLRFVVVRKFRDIDPIDLSALVVLEDVETEALRFFFLLPASGGTRVPLEQESVLVITPASPVGRKLMGRFVGDEIALPTRSLYREYTIVSVS